MISHLFYGLGLRLTFCFSMILVASCSSMVETEKVNHVHKIHSLERVDYYHWLKDESRKDPKVLSHLKVENNYVDSYLDDTRGVQGDLFKEMVGRLKEDDSAVPYFYKGYYYYTRTEKGKNHPIFCRKKTSMDANEQVLLDLNEIAKTTKNVGLGAFSVSPDQKTLAYAIDEGGKEVYDLYFKNLDTGELYKDRVKGLSPGVVWAEDNRHVFFKKMNKAFRVYRGYIYTFGKPGSEKLLFEEKDDLFDISFSKTDDDRYILMTSASFTSSEIRFVSAKNPLGKWRFIQKRVPKLEYSVEHRNGFFYVLNNHKATNFKVSKVSVRSPGMKNWKDLIKHDPEALLLSLKMQKERLIYTERRDGIVKIRYVQFSNNGRYEVKFSEPVYRVYLGSNPNYAANHLRVIFQSPITPSITYDYNFANKEFTVKKKKSVPNYNLALYETSLLMVKARDGATVPVTLIFKKGFKPGQPRPLLLYGYGSYGYTIDPTFRSNRFSLIDRGFVFAIAHIRGSQAKGRIWYDNGKLNKKHNTFNDFVDVARFLVKEKYTSKKNLVIRGGSAGGLLMGAVMNQAPDLFQAVVAEVPFVDVVTTILDPNLRYSTQEYQQWGNPNQLKDYEYMMTYSPYDNIKENKFPTVLAVAGLNDSR
ncbi:MAG: prolyl oligopeptidase family serine peptidase, partial [Pseudomonadota bacterium]